jgi:hypothetical protein
MRVVKFTNETRCTEFLALTLQNSKDFRNWGWWRDWARKTFGKLKNPVVGWLTDTMSNYDVIDHWSYIRDPANRSRPMQVFVLRRKD